MQCFVVSSLSSITNIIHKLK